MIKPYYDIVVPKGHNDVMMAGGHHDTIESYEALAAKAAMLSGPLVREAQRDERTKGPLRRNPRRVASRRGYGYGAISGASCEARSPSVERTEGPTRWARGYFRFAERLDLARRARGYDDVITSQIEDIFDSWSDYPPPLISSILPK